MDDELRQARPRIGERQAGTQPRAHGMRIDGDETLRIGDLGDRRARHVIGWRAERRAAPRPRPQSQDALERQAGHP